MDIAKVAHNEIKPWKRPWQIGFTEMQPQVLLMCKLIFLLLCTHGFYFKIDDPFVPFIGFLDFFNQYPGLFKNSMRAGFILFGTLLILNIRVRMSSIVLGLIIILAILASKPVFRNHLFIVGCALFLGGLTTKEGHPWLVNIQLSLVYIGAFINKILDSDWWTGIFMHNWLQNARVNPIYIEISSILPDYWFAIFLSWIAIFAELSIGTLILFKKYRVLGVWIAVIFHSALFGLIGIRFTHFMDGIFIMFLVFLPWPAGTVIARCKNDILGWFRKLVTFLDWDNKIMWKEDPISHDRWMEIENAGTRTYNESAMRTLLLFSTGFYIFLFAVNLICVFLIDHRILSYLVSMTFLWVGIFFFLPIPWTQMLAKLKS